MVSFRCHYECRFRFQIHIWWPLFIVWKFQTLQRYSSNVL